MAYVKRAADLKHLLDLLPPNDSARLEILHKLREMEPKITANQKKETDEMLGKLKELGNNILGGPNLVRMIDLVLKLKLSKGNFGLSTDNFKLHPNGNGGYSMEFKQ